MAVTLNIQDTFGATTPTGGYTNDASHDSEVGKAEVRDEDGDRVKLRPKKLITDRVQISGKGAADYATVAAGAFAEDAFKVTSAETEEDHSGEYIDFAIEGLIYSNAA
jgi:hypothetical protein